MAASPPLPVLEASKAVDLVGPTPKTVPATPEQAEQGVWFFNPSTSSTPTMVHSDDGKFLFYFGHGRYLAKDPEQIRWLTKLADQFGYKRL